MLCYTSKSCFLSLVKNFCLGLKRDNLYAVARICHGNSVHPSIRLSHTCSFVHCIKTAEDIIEILSYIMSNSSEHVLLSLSQSYVPVTSSSL